MARIEKTVFISYRRKDISWALAVYQYLTSQKYDVFFDFSSLSSGDFEQVIVSNIKARAHFVLILTPMALDRCSEPGDWLRREIEIAIDEKRNIIPLFFDGFSFGSPSIAEKLTGKLSAINRYNGLDIPSGYFIEAMERLSNRYLNVPLDSVIHPVSTEVRKVVKDEKVAADKALIQQKEDIKELIKPAEEKPNIEKKAVDSSFSMRRWAKDEGKLPYLRLYGIAGGIILLIAALGIFGIKSLIPMETAVPTTTRAIPTSTATNVPPTSLPTLGIGSTTNSSKDKIVMVYVPSGEFSMGSEIGQEDEKPVHMVFLDAFWIDQTEVTNSMYAKCVQDNACDKPSIVTYYANPDYANHPVVYVTWNNADSYCSWAGRKLPTEAQWEKAARGTSASTYPWGEGIDCAKANIAQEQTGRACLGDTTKVGSKEFDKSPYGVFDMAGNAREWVADWYLDTYYKNLENVNPLGPTESLEQFKVQRGGSWFSWEKDSRSANRFWALFSKSSESVGFRCTRSQ